MRHDVLRREWDAYGKLACLLLQLMLTVEAKISLSTNPTHEYKIPIILDKNLFIHRLSY